MINFRIHHIFIALIVASLFSVVLFSIVKETYQDEQGYNMSYESFAGDDTSNNVTSLLNDLDKVTTAKDTVVEIAKKAPGGEDSTAPEDSQTTEGSMQKSGLGVVIKAGQFLFSVPRVMLGGIAIFLGLDEVFVTVATAILILIVSIILVSSILRNRLWKKMGEINDDNKNNNFNFNSFNNISIYNI